MRLFFLLFGFTFAVAVGGYWMLQTVFGQRHVFGGLYRMFLYHEQHPVPYLGLVALVYSVLAAAWGVRTRAVGWRWHLGLLGVLVATLLLSSAAGGMLWTWHDMQAGYVPPWGRSIAALAGGAVNGVLLGWLIVGLSFPFNVLTTGLAYGATYLLLRRHRRRRCGA